MLLLTQELQIFRRIHENIPDSFSMEPKDYHIIRDIVGIRPQREGDARIAKEVVEGQKVIHAYGKSHIPGIQH